PRHPVGAVRKALALSERVPVITIDARDRQSARSALITVTEYALDSLTASPG
ncbi:ATP-binding protein, partial [Mycolicibacterium elephantis]